MLVLLTKQIVAVHLGKISLKGLDARDFYSNVPFVKTTFLNTGHLNFDIITNTQNRYLLTILLLYYSIIIGWL